MRNWWWLLAAIPALLILRIAGFIGDFWTGLGVVALLAFLAVLEMFPVAIRRYIAVFFAGWVILFLGLPAVWNALLATRPFTREALEKRGVATDLQLSEFADPVALRAKLGIVRYCRELENIRGEQLNRLLQQSLELQRQAPYGPYGTSVEGTQLMMGALLRQIQKDREECRRLISTSSPSVDSQGGPLGEVWSVKWLWILGIVGAILLAVLAFRARRFWSFAFLIAILLAIGWYLSDGRATTKQAVSQIQVPQVQIPGVQVQPQTGKEIVRVQLLGEEVVSDGFLGPGMVPGGWRYEFEGPLEARVHFDDGTVGPITKNYGVKGGVRRFSGPKGQEVVIKAYPPG